ncbi:hypothetical protein [Anaplasma capra]|uniref:hypothetical protein n=1 Tax=Anaplasma capra TaxID=1562740 RepID=UPI0021D5D767|nr:hypothetical protein [Anaplasma capra]MCU7611645.1 hypothetical protein [Anaplasma capra]MCU7612207.1 hypothetical protein [Anaplasma capra]
MEEQASLSHSLKEVRNSGAPLLSREGVVLYAAKTALALVAICAVMIAVCVGTANLRIYPVEIRTACSLVLSVILGLFMALFVVHRVVSSVGPTLLLRIDSPDDGLVSLFRDVFSPEKWKDMLGSGAKLTFSSEDHSWYVVARGRFPKKVSLVRDNTTVAIRLPKGYVPHKFGSYQQLKNVMRRASNLVIAFPKQESLPPILFFELRISTRADILRVMSSFDALSSGPGSLFFIYYLRIYKSLLRILYTGKSNENHDAARAMRGGGLAPIEPEIAHILADVEHNRGLFFYVLKFWSKNPGNYPNEEIQTLKALLKLIKDRALTARLHGRKIGDSTGKLGSFALIYALLPEESRCCAGMAVDMEALRKQFRDFLRKRREIRYIAACMDRTIGSVLCERFQDAGYAYSWCFRIFGLLFHSSTTDDQMLELYQNNLIECMFAFHEFPMLKSCAAYSFMAKRFTEDTGMDLLDATHANNMLKSNRAREGVVIKRASSMLYYMCDALGFRSITYEALSTVIAKSILRLYRDALGSLHMEKILCAYDCQIEIPAVDNWRCVGITGRRYETVMEHASFYKLSDVGAIYRG